MAKLDMSRKMVVVGIIVAAICFLILGRGPQGEKVSQAAPETAQAPVAAAQASAAAAQPSDKVQPVETAQASETAKPAAEVPVEMARPPIADMDQTPALNKPYHATLAFDPSKSEQVFLVYQDKPSRNHYIPSGFMPTADCMTFDDVWVQGCQEGRSCIKVTYDVACSVQHQAWSGVYWLDPANNWGDVKGGYNLTGAKKLVFWAKGEKGGEVINEFKMGGIGVNRAYTDTDTIGIGPVTLSNQWQEYTIDLKGRDLSHIIGGFALVTHANDNAGMVTFYLDNIHYE